MSSKILVVDDERSIMNIIAFNLKKEGYTVVCAEDGEQALQVFQAEQPELILLDVMMPKLDGYGVCKEIRKVSQVPIIMLTARADEMDKVFGLDLGADDYVTKPFSNKELMARVKANIRRSPLQMQEIQKAYQVQQKVLKQMQLQQQEQQENYKKQLEYNTKQYAENQIENQIKNQAEQPQISQNKVIQQAQMDQPNYQADKFNQQYEQVDQQSEQSEQSETKRNSLNFTSIMKASTKEMLLKVKKPKKSKQTYADLKIDFERFEVFKNRKAINLTTREFELLRFLAMNQNQIFTREELLSEVWGYKYIGDIRAVDVGIRRLREKIEDDASKPKYVLTKRGMGYYFAP